MLPIHVAETLAIARFPLFVINLWCSIQQRPEVTVAARPEVHPSLRPQEQPSQVRVAGHKRLTDLRHCKPLRPEPRLAKILVEMFHSPGCVSAFENEMPPALDRRKQ